MISADLLQRERLRFLGSHAVQCATLYEIWLDELGEAEAARRWEAAQRYPIVPRDFRRFRSSAVEWFNMPRRTSGFRKICRFQDAEKMWHRLARDLITSQHQPRPHIGDWSGRGREKQMISLAAAVRSGQQAVVCADIRRAFASVNIDAAYDLHFLPEPLIRRAIDYRTHRFLRRERSAFAREIALATTTDLEVSPAGLMEGSPASNAIFAVMMDDLPDHLGERIQTFSYCDNIILLAEGMAEAQRAEAALVAYLTNHRAGPFEVIASAQSVCEPFEHLGYQLQWRGELQVSLSTTNWLRFMHRIERGDWVRSRLALDTSFSCCTADARSIYDEVLVAEQRYRRNSSG